MINVSTDRHTADLENPSKVFCVFSFDLVYQRSTTSCPDHLIQSYNFAGRMIIMTSGYW